MNITTVVRHASKSSYQMCRKLITNQAQESIPNHIVTDSGAVTIRQTKKEDCKSIHGLMKELATALKMPGQPKLSYKDLERDGFDTKSPLYECYSAVCNGDVIAYAFYYYSYSTIYGKSIYFEDLYNSPKFRSYGIGNRLYDSIVQKAISEKCPVIDLSVLSWNPVQYLYKKKGTVNITEKDNWHAYRLDKSTIQNISTGNLENSKHIRKSRREDLRGIRELSKDMVQQRRLNEVQNVNWEEMEKSIFDVNDPPVGIFVAEINGKIVGYALYWYSYPSFSGKGLWLQDLYVTTMPKRKDIELSLFEAIIEKSRNENCSLYSRTTDQNFGKDFYLSKGGIDITEQEEWHCFRIDVEDVMNKFPNLTK